MGDYKAVLRKSHINKIDNLDEMNKSLERHKPVKLTQEEKEKLNIPTSKDSKLIIRKLLTKKPSPIWLHWGILPNL